MATTTDFKDMLDLPEWRYMAYPLIGATPGLHLSSDLRNNDDADPNLWFISAVNIMAYNKKNDGWKYAYGATCAMVISGCSVFVPHEGPRGDVSAVTSNSEINITLPASYTIGRNSWANRDDGQGYRIKFISNGSGSSCGKTCIRTIIGNSGVIIGTAMTIKLNKGLPAGFIAGDKWELMSGRLYILSSGARTFKYYDIATGTLSGALTTITNLPATFSTDSTIISLSELHVPYNRQPGEGFIVGTGTYNEGEHLCLTATAMAAGTLTGQTSGGDYAIPANLFRNFQIRIVEDTVNKTSVGQRRKIFSHTGGAGTTPVYTLANGNWAVTPSANAKYVIEYPGDYLMLWTTGDVKTYTCALRGYYLSPDVAETWYDNLFANFTTAHGFGVSAFASFSLAIDADPLWYVKPGMIYLLKGAGTSTIDCLDISGGTTGSWETGGTTVIYSNKLSTFTTGTSAEQDPVSNDGRYVYINPSFGVLSGQYMFRFDMLNRVLEPWAFIRATQGTIVGGKKMAFGCYIDGTKKISFMYHILHTTIGMYQCLISR